MLGKGSPGPRRALNQSTAQDHRDRHAPIEFLKSRFLHFCNGFAVPGSASAEYLKDLGITNDRIFQARNAVDVELFSKLAQKSRNHEIQIRSELSLPSRYYLYVGRFVKEKGVFDLLQAYAQLGPRLRSEVGLVLAGNGADQYELIKQASRIKPGTIRFVGFVHREQLPGLYAFADALILPTHSDTWGLVVNEGMSCGLPVIVTNVAGCGARLGEGWLERVCDPSGQFCSIIDRHGSTGRQFRIAEANGHTKPANHTRVLS